MRGAKQLLSSARTGTGRDDWQTPPRVLDVVRRHAPIGLDACTAPDNPTGALMHYTEADDGLALPWRIRELAEPLVWCNPPYSNSKDWIAKAEAEAGAGAEVIMLIASRTGANYFAPVYRANAICFVTGRITFHDADTGKPALDPKGKPMPATFDSVLVYWGKRSGRFRRKVGCLGEVVIPLIQKRGR